MASRLLLPFTSGVSSQAITCAVQLARSQNAVLVPLVLIQYKAGSASRNVRLEHIQQSQDFLEMVRTIAARLHVSVECYECQTSDVVSSITQLSSELACESQVVVMSTHKTWLMQSHEAQALLKQADISLMLIHMQARSQRNESMVIEHILHNCSPEKIQQTSELLLSQ